MMEIKVINRETLTNLRRLLVTLYDEPQTIRVIAEDAGLNVARINMGGSAVNIWHAVLSEAQKVGQISALVQTVLLDDAQATDAFRAILGSDFLPIEQSQSSVSTTPSTIAKTSASAPNTPASEPVATASRQPQDEVLRPPPTADRPIKILFLAANPLDSVRLRTDEEARAIDQALRQAENRNFVISGHGAVRIDDLQELLLRHNPDIVHFSGHGAEAQALILQGANGHGVEVSGAALRQLFGLLKGNIRCIVLNACYTATQAESLAEVIDCVVGIEDLISDDAARQFSTAFYRALGYGRSLQEAFALGQVQIELAGLGEANALHLLTSEDGATATDKATKPLS